MKLVTQPRHSTLCGQACVAMICSIDLDTAIELVGTRGATRTRHLRDAIRSMTIAVGDRHVRGMPKQGSALLYWRSADGRTHHWTLYHNGKHYDPIGYKGRNPPRHLTEGGRLLSHLPVTIPRY